MSFQSDQLRVTGRRKKAVESRTPRPRSCLGDSWPLASFSSADSRSSKTRYALVTAARNESAHLERLIRSVASQTILPVLWIIVSDASADSTDEIVTKCAVRFPWIKLLRMNEPGERDFGRKALCFNAGWQHVREIPFDVIANVDADVSFAPDYIAVLLSKFEASSDLGIAGTPHSDGSYVSFGHRWADLNYVSGQFQMFRRTCLEDVGGYLPVREGGIDTIAVMMAKAKGWKTQTFVDQTFSHHRKMGTWAGSSRYLCFREGYRDYLLGNHPLWQFVRSLFLMSQTPIILGGLLYWFGYLLAFVSRRKKAMPWNCVRLRRHEQMQRLPAIGRGIFSQVFRCVPQIHLSRYRKTGV
jgi:poly-beta-1,6-N-acetyl-D-glucosamine synthase